MPWASNLCFKERAISKFRTKQLGLCAVSIPSYLHVPSSFQRHFVGVLTVIPQNPPFPAHQMNRFIKTWSANEMGLVTVTCQMLVSKVPHHTEVEPLSDAVEVITFFAGRPSTLFLDGEPAASGSKRSLSCYSRWKGPEPWLSEPFLVCHSSLTPGLPSTLATTKTHIPTTATSSRPQNFWHTH